MVCFSLRALSVFAFHYHFPYFTHAPQVSCVERSSTVVAQRLQASQKITLKWVFSDKKEGWDEAILYIYP